MIIVPTQQTQIVADILRERAAQDAQWGGPAHDDKHTDDEWREYREKFEARIADPRTAPKAQRDAMIKLAALVLAQLESLDRQIKAKKS